MTADVLAMAIEETWSGLLVTLEDFPYRYGIPGQFSAAALHLLRDYWSFADPLHEIKPVKYPMIERATLKLIRAKVPDASSSFVLHATIRPSGGTDVELVDHSPNRCFPQLPEAAAAAQAMFDQAETLMYQLGGERFREYSHPAVSIFS